jgi:hypothetical protein
MQKQEARWKLEEGRKTVTGYRLQAAGFRLQGAKNHEILSDGKVFTMYVFSTVNSGPPIGHKEE